jgi:signal transduction histidine kinase
MNASSIPALISFVLNIVLSLVAWLYRARDRLNVAFAFFTTVIALISLSCFFLLKSESVNPSSFWFRATLSLAPILLFSAQYFVLVLTGYINKLEEKLFKIPLKKYVFMVIGYTVLSIVLIHFSSANIMMLYLLNSDSINVMQYFRSPIVIMAFVFGILVLVIATAMVIKTLREAKKGPRRNYLRMIVAGLAVIYFSVPFFKILPFFGIPGFSYIFISTSLGSIIFFMAIIRHQFDQINELNIGLEKKVEDRTRDLRAAQARLVESEKVASLGRLVAGVAHEFNNPIGVVKSTNSTIRRGLEKLENVLSKSVNNDTSEVKEINKLIGIIEDSRRTNEEGAERVSDMVNRMKGFVQLDEAELQRVDIHEGIEDTLVMLQHDLVDNVTIIREFGNLPHVTCFSARMNQVFYNILLNAAQAVSEKGEIRIKTDCNGEEIMVKFIDNGRGIQPDHLDKVFEPGFTTRGVGVGTGLGLTHAYQVMQDHSGDIQVQSRYGSGTEVILKFPIRQ